MALIKTTAIVDAISGKLQGTVFARNKGGAYMRGRGTVSNPSTVAQSEVRSQFGSISQAWRSLTEADRRLWNNIAGENTYQNRLGDSRSLTGKAYFQQANGNLNTLGIEYLEEPIAPQGVSAPSRIARPLEIAGGAVDSIDFELLVTSAGVNTAFVVEATPSLSVGVSNAKNQYRKIGYTGSVALGTESVSSADFQEPDALLQSYVLVHGEPIVGSKIFVRVKGINVNTGEASTYLELSAIVTEGV